MVCLSVNSAGGVFGKGRGLPAPELDGLFYRRREVFVPFYLEDNILARGNGHTVRVKKLGRVHSRANVAVERYANISHRINERLTRVINYRFRL